MTNKILDNFITTLYKLNLPGYCGVMGDEPHDSFRHDLMEYWRDQILNKVFGVTL